MTVKTGLFGLKETFVPLEQAIVADGKITTPYSTEKIKEAPRVDPDKHLDAVLEEAQLYNYYGIATIVAVEPHAAAEAASEDDTADEAAKDIVDVQVEATETEPLTEADDLGLAEDLTTAEDAAAAEITQDDVVTEVADNDAVAEVTDDDTDSADLDVTEDDVTGEVIEGAAGQPTEFTTGSAGSGRRRMRPSRPPPSRARHSRTKHRRTMLRPASRPSRSTARISTTPATTGRVDRGDQRTTTDRGRLLRVAQ